MCRSCFPNNIQNIPRCFPFRPFRFQVGDFSAHNMKMLLILFLIIICSHVSMNQDSGKEKTGKNFLTHFGKYMILTSLKVEFRFTLS